MKWKILYLAPLIAMNLNCSSTDNGLTNKNNDPINNTTIQLRDGVVTSQNKTLLFVSNPDQTIECLELISGKSLWRSPEKGRPLLLQGEELLFQKSSNPLDKNLVIGNLNVKSREVKSTNNKVLKMEDNIVTNIKNSVNSTFRITPVQFKNNYYLDWTYTPRIRGINDGKTQEIKKGIFQLNGDSLTTIDRKALPSDYNANSILVSKINRISQEQGQQFISKDKRHILVSQFNSESPKTALNYKWSIYDSTTKTLIGEFQNQVSYAPFLVNGNIILFEQGPRSTFGGNDNTSTPLLIIWHDLTTNKQINSKAILDTEYRGPYPS